MTRYFYEMLLNSQFNTDFGTTLKKQNPMLFNHMFFMFWLDCYKEPDQKMIPQNLIILPRDPISSYGYELSLNGFCRDLGTHIKQLSENLFEQMFYTFWLCHTPKQIRRAAVIKMKSYQSDPKFMTSRFKGTCHKCGKSIAKGERIIYFPNGKHAYHVPCGQADYDQFSSAAWDEEVNSIMHVR